MVSSENIPETLGNLTSLKFLDLAGNELSGTYPPCMYPGRALSNW
jgi:Leucine-rich repeat (LRR) protein